MYTMGSTSDLQKLLRQKDERILELERILKARDDQVAELRTKLDKFQSVLHTSNSLVNIGKGPRNKRAVGISAEPQSQKSVKELADVKFQKHPKSKRKALFGRISSITPSYANSVVD